MKVFHRIALAGGLGGALAVLFSGGTPEDLSAAIEPPAPSAMTIRRLAGGVTRRRIELVASRIDLGHLGVHTHANWVVFELPFATNDARIFNVHFSPRALVDTDVGALFTPLGCVPTPALGPVEHPRWTKYTRTAIAGTTHLDSHPLAPTSDPRAYAINVPTRVANAAACGEPALASPSTWRLVVEWDSRSL